MKKNKNLKPIVIIGAGGFAREVLDTIDALNDEKPQFEMIGYIVDEQYGTPGTIINDKPILGGFDWLENKFDKVLVTCGVGAPHHRHQLIHRANVIRCRFISLIHPTATITRWIQIGEGVVITAGCILTNLIKISDHVHINLSCTIGHDVVIEDFVTLSPGVHVSGNVYIKQGSSIGTGTNIIEKITIGSWSIIGAGSTIVTDVPENTTAVGVPGRVIKTRPEGWHLV
jgi:sugar O-acyltransferase (sialic acid O-acetyltransferase NeuD family)